MLFRKSPGAENRAVAEMAHATPQDGGKPQAAAALQDLLDAITQAFVACPCSGVLRMTTCRRWFCQPFLRSICFWLGGRGGRGPSLSRFANDIASNGARTFASLSK